MLKKKSTDPAAMDVEALRAELAHLKAQRAEIADAAPARSDMLHRLDAAITARAEEYRPSLAGIADDANLGFALKSNFAAMHADAAADVIRAECFFHPAQVREQFIALIDKRLKGSAPGLPASERVGALKRLDGKIMDVEVAEERAIAALEDAGQPLARRIDIDPAAFFEAHGREAGRERMLTLLDATDAAHVVALRATDRLREVQKERNRQIAGLDEDSQHKIASRDGDGKIVTLWDERKAAIDDKYAAELARLTAAAAAAQARWQPMATVATVLREYAERNGITPERVSVMVSK